MSSLLLVAVVAGCDDTDHPNIDVGGGTDAGMANDAGGTDAGSDGGTARACDLRLSKSVEEHSGAGGTAIYQITVDNAGGTACAPPITVTDSLPPNVSFASASTSDWTCQTTSANPEEVECDYEGGALAPYSTSTFAIEVDIGDGACMSTNCADVGNTPPDGASDDSPRFDSTPDNNRDCAGVHCAQSDDDCAEPPSGMVGWWTADQTVEDASVEGNDGLMKNGLYYTTGHVLEAFGLDGQDDHVEVPDDSSLDVAEDGAITIDAWVHPTGEQDVRTIVDKRAATSAGSTGYALQIRSETLVVRLQTDSTGVTYTSSGSVPVGEWTHVTVAADLEDDSGTVYLNGSQDGTLTPSSTAGGSLANDSPLLIGRGYDGERHFRGRIDEVEIFDRALTANEVESIVEVGPCGKCRVPCEEGSASFEAGGTDDDFDGNDSASPSQYLQDNYPLKDFDDATANRHVGHTFTDLKPELKYKRICSAELEIRMRPTDTTLVSNDGMRLSFSENGTQVGPSWGSRLGGSNGLVSNTWHPSDQGPHTFTLDLANLPPSGGNPTDLLGALDNYQMLNVRVQDDTEVDYAILRVEYCCDDGEPSGEPDVAVEKSHEGDLSIGQTSTYTVSVDNVGDATASPPVEVTDEVPACMEIVGVQSPWDAWCNVSGNQVECEYPDPITPGNGTPDLQLDVRPTEECGDLAENCAEVAHPDDGNPDNDSSCDESPISRAEADLGVEKSAVDPPFELGSQGTWEVTVTNHGSAEAQPPITVEDDLPSCVQYVSASPSAWNCSASSGQVTCEHPDPLPAGQSRTVELTAEFGRACSNTDVVENCAKVSASSPTDPDPSNNETCVTDEVVKASTDADLALEKSHAGKLDSGAKNTYAISVTNNGPDAASSPVEVSDDLPSCMSYSSAAPSGWSCSSSSGVVTCNYGSSIASGQTVQLDLEVELASGCGDMVSNCARVSHPDDPDSSNDEGCDDSLINF